jgi:hypothetical protein
VWHAGTVDIRRVLLIFHVELPKSLLEPYCNSTYKHLCKHLHCLNLQCCYEFGPPLSSDLDVILATSGILVKYKKID